MHGYAWSLITVLDVTIYLSLVSIYLALLTVTIIPKIKVHFPGKDSTLALRPGSQSIMFPK